ncbi:hypothetical protein ACFTXJ_30930 [Streptomyces zhihengii]|uniref:hypothetical protein n=1 Tax=Streptomyces zhihengii TaxID=1818004 RepID=UPI003642E9EB
MSLGDEHGGGRTSDGFGGSGQTRTRLPGAGEGDGYGGPRRPVRPSRSLIGVVGVVVLLIAAIAFANQGSGDGGDAADGAKPPGTNPTSATGTRPVEGKSGDIPTGYAQDEQGAQSAAANYAVALGSDGMFTSTSRRTIIETTHVPTVVPGLVSDLDSAYSEGFLANVGLTADGKAPEGQTFVSRTMPVGTKVTAAGTDAMTVEVWCTGLVGLAGQDSTKPVTTTWFTITEKLKWVDNDWKIESSTQSEGPTPINGDNRASSADEIAGAVAGYGGFTYAR